MTYSKVLLLFALALLVTRSAAAQKRFQVVGMAQGLSRVTSEKTDEFGPAISPDGHSLLFDTRLQRNDAVIVGVDPSTGAKRTVFTSSGSQAEQVAWDPNGKFFVYTSNAPGNWSLVRTLSSSPNAAVAIIVGGESAPLASDPSISPDGKRVAFSTFLRMAWNIGISDLTGANFTLMGVGKDPAWSPDGKTLAFVKMAGGRAHIFSVDVETGANLTQITSGESDNTDPAWSPDGRYIVFTSNRGAKKPPRSYHDRALSDRDRRTGRFNLVAVHPDGTGLVQLTDGDAQVWQPVWGRDGWIYFSSNQDKGFDIWRIKPAGELAETSGNP